jgi:uncharacterized RDD family membrane protein YckC
MGVSGQVERPPAYGARLVAGGIDVLLAAVPLLLLFYSVARSAPAGTIGLGGSLDITIGSTEHYLVGGQAILFVGLALAIWTIVFGLVPVVFGATAGMIAAGLQIIGVDGRPVTFGRHMARTAAWLLDGFPYVLPGAMAFVCIVATPSRRRVGDRLAGTAVVHVRAPVPAPGASESREAEPGAPAAKVS